ncbi:MAG: hypothetical protein O7G85_03370 [Planctomycetota bacterium]|nr:hypothetical protein [Planctomycetota bacterium]
MTMRRFGICLICCQLQVGCQESSSSRLSNGSGAVFSDGVSGEYHAYDGSTDADRSSWTVPPALNSDWDAAQSIALSPPLIEPIAIREIRLHGALYRAAFDTNAAHDTRHYLLVPLPIMELPFLTISPREFRLRILASLVDLQSSFAWTGNEASNERPEKPDFFPNSSFRATRLLFRITERSEQGDVVKGELADMTYDEASSRQGFTATWDGEDWTIKRDRVRTIR